MILCRYMKKLSKEHKLALKKAWIKRRQKGLGVSWNKGKKHSITHKSNLKKAWLKRKKKGLGDPWNKGKKLSLEHAAKCRIARVGTTHTKEWKEKMSVMMMGKKNHNYKHGKCRDSRIHYNDLRYKIWREAVYERDDYTCQECFSKGCYLEAHHIKGWTYYPKFRYVVSNGVTLCKECHKKTDNYCGKKVEL